MADELDDILKEVEKRRRGGADGAPRPMSAEEALEKRKDKVSGFQLQLNLDEEIPDVPAPSAAARPVRTEAEVPAFIPPPRPEKAADLPAAHTPGRRDRPGKRRAKEKMTEAEKQAWGCSKSIFYAIAVVAASGILAFTIIFAGLDIFALSKSNTPVAVTITAEQAGSTRQVSHVLKEKGIIDHPLIFQMYCLFKGKNGTFQPQEDATMRPNMGYKGVINVLQTVVREEIKVTFPEGSTVQDMAGLLESSGICSTADFYTALEKFPLTEEFREDYPFLAEIPQGDAYKGRFYMLEGFLFPDTYLFYEDSSAETVLKKMLDNFNNRIDPNLRAEIKIANTNLYDVITLASIIQWEAGDTQDMYRISRVLHNRLENTAAYPKLECDSTKRYVREMTPAISGETVENTDYDTYVRNGLPIGPITNPGMDAIKSALRPSDEAAYKKYYFFATDSDGVTHYTRTYAEHQAICKKYGIGMYAK